MLINTEHHAVSLRHVLLAVWLRLRAHQQSCCTSRRVSTEMGDRSRL